MTFRETLIRPRRVGGEMKLPLRSAAGILALGLILATPFAGSAASVAPTHVLAVLPLSPVDIGVPYATLPSKSELDTMSQKLREPFVKTESATLVPQAKVQRALTGAGYDQYSTLRACVTPECAQKIGKLVGADRVVMGGVTREMAVVWSTDVSVIDVKTGRLVTELRAGYKGDEQAMVRGETIAATCIVRVLDKKAPCKDDPGY